MMSACASCMPSYSEQELHRTQPSRLIGEGVAISELGQVDEETGEPIEVRCPMCAEKIQSTARKCRHCGEMLPQPGSPGQPNLGASVGGARESDSGSGRRAFGWLALLAGGAWLFAALTMNTTVSSGGEYIGGMYIPRNEVHNIGLMDEKRNQVTAAGVLTLVGVILVAVGGSNRRP